MLHLLGPVAIYCDFTDQECPTTVITHPKVNGEEIGNSCEHGGCHETAIMYYPITDSQLMKFTVFSLVIISPFN